MTSFDLHPEELLDRVRRGQATAAERERVLEHLRSCEACRFEHALLAQAVRDAAPQPGDAARARRIEQGALAALAARGAGTSAPAATAAGSAAVGSAAAGSAVVDARSRRRRRASALIAAAIVSSLATAAAAAVIQQPEWIAKWIPIQLAQPAAPTVSTARLARKAQIHHPPAPPPSATASDSASASASDSVSASASDSASVSASVSESVPHPSHRTPADLFAAANLARREQKTAIAVRLYRDLLRAHPHSDEAAVSRVALGRLLLDRARDARGALREFDAYLQTVGQGALREDALIGRALALGRLGRAREEHAAWKALLAAFPSSGYAERARARLIELRCAVEPC